jgi:L-fuconolactonase
LGIAVYFLRPGQPEQIAEVAERFPGLRIVANHLSLGGERSPELLTAHLDKLASLVPHQNVAVTISSLPMSSHQDYPYADLHDAIRRVFDLFGTARLAWATDYTAARSRLGEAITYRKLRDFVDVAVPGLSESERAALFGGTVSRWLNW